MCGINAIISPYTPVSKNTILEMNESLRHRGPNSSGIWMSRDHSVALGHTRLSILGLGPSGFQPMHSADQKWVIVFNGEIYNHQEIRKSLPIIKWNGSSDTETLVNAISFWGVLKCLSKIKGMYAFAAYNKISNNLYLARDPFGEKPISLFQSKEKIIVSSELSGIKSVLKNVEINGAFIGDFLQNGFSPSNSTIYKKVFTIDPGEVYKVNSFNLKIKKYNKSNIPRTCNIDNLNDGICKLDQIFLKTLKDICISEVPIGILLSGGIDSRLIAAYVHKNNIQNISFFFNWI